MSDTTSVFTVVEERPSESVAVVVVGGEVDMRTAEAFEEALVRAVGERAGTGLVVDLTGVTFIGTVGLNALVRAFERQRLSGSGLALVSNDSRVSMILEVTRLDRVLKRFSDRAAAVEAVSQ